MMRRRLSREALGENIPKRKDNRSKVPEVHTLGMLCWGNQEATVVGAQREGKAGQRWRS